MSAAGDAVLAMAYSQVGTVEGPNNSVPYWDWWGANLGSWCAVFVSWCDEMAGYPCCPVNGPKGFVSCDSGTDHMYPEGEAYPTTELQPGDTVIYSWYGWGWVDGVPTINEGEWAGWTAGDHTGVVASPADGSGYFWAVEGNTSDGSADNGGMVLERQRHISQVCGWWRPPSIAGAWNGSNDPTDDLGEFLMNNDELVAQLARIEQKCDSAAGYADFATQLCGQIIGHLGNFPYPPPGDHVGDTTWEHARDAHTIAGWNNDILNKVNEWLGGQT